MTRQNLREREAAIILDQLSGKLTIRQIRDHLKANGFIDIGEDVIDQLEIEQARQYVRSCRRYHDKTGGVQMEMVSLYETLEDGSRLNYYRKVGELTVEEGVQLLEYCYKHRKYWDGELQKYYQPLVKKHGRRLQKLMPFAVPKVAPKAPRARKAAAPSAN